MIKKSLLYVVSFISGLILLIFTLLMLIVAACTITVGVPVSLLGILGSKLADWSKSEREEINK